jgi:hypothetical protein
MPSLRSRRGAAVAAALLATVASTVEAQGSGTNVCSWNAALGSANGTCATYTIARTESGGRSNFTITIQNTTPTGRGPQIFGTIFAYVPAGVGEGQVTNFTSNPATYTLGNAPFNGEIFLQGVSQGNNQSIIDWTATNPNVALGIGQSATFTFSLPGTVSITRLGVHAQRVGANGEGSQWVVFPGSTPINPNVVPEPSTYALMATGLVGLVVMARRRRQV